MYTYLALGDSYTIGEGVMLTETFPYQTVQLLRKAGLPFTSPEIIAKTGWTSDELHKNLSNYQTLKTYDIVSLLIGVNNQYRGYNIDQFKKDFEDHIRTALKYTSGKSEKVFVLSIPDWGLTPFASGRDSKKITAEIDQYNQACEQIATKYKITFINITNEYRKFATREDFLVDDKLHPSGKEYAKWAKQLSDHIKKIKF